MSDAIRVNGNVHDYGSIVVTINGEKYHGLTAIKYNHKRERSKLYGLGAHRAPRARTRGRYSAEGSFIGPKSTIEAMRAQLDDGTGNYGDTEFLTVANFVDANEEPVLIELVDCVFAEEDASDEEASIDASMEEVKLDLMYIRKNGRTLFNNSDGTR